MNVKNVTIFGGTGETGLLVVKNALAKGYGVTVYARSPSKLTFEHHNLDVLEGDLDDFNQVKKAVQATNAVISVLGSKGKTKDTLISDGTKNIILAMEQTRVKRLIATATPSFRVEEDEFHLGFDFRDLVMKNLFKTRYRDIIKTGEIITGSNLNWTVVRVPVLNNKPATGNLRVGYTGDGNVRFFSLSKEDLANFLVQQVESRSYIRKAPVVSN